MPRSIDTVCHRLLQQAIDRPSEVAYQQKINGQWQPTTWQTYVSQVRTAARALIALGFKRGSKVAILGFNRPEWVILDHAAMLAGGAAAGIYTTCSPDEVQYIVHHSEALVVLVEDATQLEKIRARRDKMPLLKAVVMMRGAAPVADAMSWDAFLAEAQSVSDKVLDEHIDAIKEDDLATLIYTSGTTGPPKGVMLSHRNLAWTSRTLLQLVGTRANDVSLSYLPLSHIAEQMATILLPTSAGSTVYFAESLEKLADNIKEVRPTMFFGVPRIWEKFHAALSAKLGEVTGVKKHLVQWARRVCGEVNARRDRSQPVDGLLNLQYKLVNKLVITKLKTALGFDRVTMVISGAAPISGEILEFFSSLDLPIREIYGQSEDTGPTSFNLPGKTKIGSVGPALPGLECKIAEDGEILVRGPNVFLGYYKEPEATADTLKDGWLYSGDLGAFDQDGYLLITGRKKEIIITAGGKNITPKNIESAIKHSPLVSEVVVIGDRRKFLTALITLDEAAARKLVPEGDLAAAPAVRDAIQKQIDEVNQTLARVEQIKKFTILPRPFGIDTGELTPTLKIKRSVVAKNFASEIEAMYAGNNDL